MLQLTGYNFAESFGAAARGMHKPQDMNWVINNPKFNNKFFHGENFVNLHTQINVLILSFITHFYTQLSSLT